MGAREAGIVPCPCMIACLASAHFASCMRALWGYSGFDCPFGFSVSSGSYSAFLLPFLSASSVLLHSLVLERECRAFEASRQSTTELRVHLRHGLGDSSRTSGRFWTLRRAARTKHLRHKGYSVGYSDPSLLGLDHDILHCSACRVDGLAVPAASCCMMPHPPSSVTENLDPIPRRAYPALLPPQATRAPSRRRTQGTHHTPA